MNDEEFCNYLLKKKKVVLIPGHYFGDFGKGHVRFTFVSETLKRIEEGFERIASIL
jgi:aspartate/methionine/tyrosine aminotransferase